MAYFKNAQKFFNKNRPNDSRGGFKGNKPWDKRPHDRGNDRGSDRRDRGPVSLHQATCASCGKTCEVPFKPNGRKPVYCKDCFSRDGGNADTRNNSPRPSFNDRGHDRPAQQPAAAPKSDAFEKEIASLNKKIDGLITSLDFAVSLVRTIEAQLTAQKAPEAAAPQPKKKVKKVTKKK